MWLYKKQENMFRCLEWHDRMMYRCWKRFNTAKSLFYSPKVSVWPWIQALHEGKVRCFENRIKHYSPMRIQTRIEISCHTGTSCPLGVIWLCSELHKSLKDILQHLLPHSLNKASCKQTFARKIFMEVNKGMQFLILQNNTTAKTFYKWPIFI